MRHRMSVGSSGVSAARTGPEQVVEGYVPACPTTGRWPGSTAAADVRAIRSTRSRAVDVDAAIEVPGRAQRQQCLADVVRLPAAFPELGIRVHGMVAERDRVLARVSCASRMGAGPGLNGLRNQRRT